MTIENRRPILLGIILTIGLLALVTYGPKLLLASTGLHVETMTMFWTSRLLLWLWLIFVWQFAKRIEHASLLSPQKRYGPVQLGLSAILILLTIFIAGLFVSILVRYLHWQTASDQLSLLTHLSTAGKISAILTAAIVEELVFRGYILSRMEKLLHNGNAAILSSALIFGLAHAGYGNIVNMLMPFIIGLIFGIYQYRYKNIWVLIVCHALIDGYALFGHR